MTDDPQYRSTHTHAPDAITLREADEVADDAMMEIRLPIASTGEVRNEGDDPLTRAELRGMARQINENTLGVFPEHGNSDVIDFAGYSQFEKLGYWTDAEVDREAADDGEDMLYATARMPDPEPLPSQTGSYRQALSIIKEQARRGVPITTSIGWREDENSPGGNDLLEVSIVGIAADPRTGTEGGQALIARAAVDAGADPEALVDAVREAVEARPFGPPQGPDDLWEDFDECVADVESWEGIDDPEAFCAWAEDQSREDTHDMTDDDTETETEPDDAEQTASDDGEDTETRAPGDIELLDWAELLASHIDGVDSADLMEAWEPFAEDYVGEVNLNELASFVGEIVDNDTGAVQEAFDDLMGGEQADDDDDEDEEDDDDREADPDEETEDDDRDLDELVERIEGLEADLQAVRSGEVDIDTPDPDDDADGEERDADADDVEERDMTDPADKPDWLTID